MSKELVKYLSGFITENRLKRFEDVLQHRTRHLTVVLEDIYQPHNAAAVLRSCDCFGIQDVHVIENQNKFEANPDVELGSAKWITMHKYNAQKENTADCIASLKKNGYKIVVTSPHKNDCSIAELDITNKTALFFGTEMRGATPVAFEQADAFDVLLEPVFTQFDHLLRRFDLLEQRAGGLVDADIGGLRGQHHRDQHLVGIAEFQLGLWRGVGFGEAAEEFENVGAFHLQPQHLGHGVTPRGFADQPMCSFDCALGEDRAVFRDVRQGDAFVVGQQVHGMVAGDAAAAQRGKADRAGCPRPGYSVTGARAVVGQLDAAPLGGGFAQQQRGA